MYRARQKIRSQVARILFLLLLTTSAWPCLKNSRNLGTILLPGPVCFPRIKPVVGSEAVPHGAAVHLEGSLAATESVLCASVSLVPIQQIFHALTRIIWVVD